MKRLRGGGVPVRRSRFRVGDLAEIYRMLLHAHGRQHWWPGESRLEIMVGAVLTQNTAWVNVERSIANLKAAGRLHSPEAIIRARRDSLARWLRPSGYFNVKATRVRALCRWIIAQGGLRKLVRVSTSVLREALLKVHGVGPETADDIVLYAFNRPVFVIDAYTRRLFSRLGIIKGDEPYEALRSMFESGLRSDTSLFNEYHALIVFHAKHICRGRRPLCERCCLSERCRFQVSHAG